MSRPACARAAPWLLGPLQGRCRTWRRRARGCAPTSTSRSSCCSRAWLVAWACAPALPVRVVAAAVGRGAGRLRPRPAAAADRRLQLHLYGRMARCTGSTPTARPVAGAARPGLRAGQLAPPAQPVRPAVHAALRAARRCCRCPSRSGRGRRRRRLRARRARAGLVAGAAPGPLAAARDRRAGLCPVTLAVGVGGFHNDVPAVLCVVAAAWCLVRGRDARRARWDAAAGALVVAAAGIKPPFAIVVAARRARRAPAPGAIAGAAAAARGRRGSSSSSPSAARCPSSAPRARSSRRSACRTCSGWPPATAAPTQPCARPAATRWSSSSLAAPRGGGAGGAGWALPRDRRRPARGVPDSAVGDALVPGVGAAVRRARRARGCSPRSPSSPAVWLGVGGMPADAEADPRTAATSRRARRPGWPTTERTSSGCVPMSAELGRGSRASALVGVVQHRC